MSAGRYQMLTVFTIEGFLFLYCNVYAQQNSNTARCVPFPHSNLYCGQYIDADKIVHVDTNFFNYTELNNVLEDVIVMIDDPSVKTPCRWQVPYMICQSMYPQCDNRAQAVVPVCMDNCLNYTQLCGTWFIDLQMIANVVMDPLVQLFVLNCSDQFQHFQSITVDTGPNNCYNFYLAPIFLPVPGIIALNNTVAKVIKFTQPDTYTPLCSQLELEYLVLCIAYGVPEPQVDIYREYVNKSSTKLEWLVQAKSYVVAELLPDDLSGKVAMLRCQASNIVATWNMRINLTFTCCNDDKGNRHSLGQSFMTTDCHRCFCNNMGNISCDQPQCDRDEPGISTGIIVVIVVVIILVVVVMVVILFGLLQSTKGNYRRALTMFRVSSLAVNPAACSKNTSVDSGQNLLRAVSTLSTGVSIDDKPHTDSIPIPATSEYSYAGTPKTILRSLLPKEFDATPELITKVMISHQLEDFIKAQDRLTIINTLGEGAFGKVLYGLLKNENDEPDIEVAVKTMKDCLSMEGLNQFIGESVIMKHVKHRNVLGLVGVSIGVEEDKAVPYIIIPFMANGDLKGYLKDKRLAAGRDVKALFKEINYLTLVRICCDISCGMEYLASIKFVHRDLAARNCMVDKDLVIKVADFGLARDIYADDYYRMGHKSKVPIKWMSPESIHDRYYDQKTDVWAFGVVCWEVFSLGRVPYAGVDKQELPEYIESGKRLRKPALCSDEMYQVMSSCWQLKNSDRPVFSALEEQLEQHYSDVMESNPSDPSSPYHNLFDETAFINWKPE